MFLRGVHSHGAEFHIFIVTRISRMTAQVNLVFCGKLSSNAAAVMSAWLIAPVEYPGFGIIA